MATYKWDKELKKVVCCDTGIGHGNPDVYFKTPYVDEHISSEEFPGPKFISSKREKAYWMNKCHLREAGDRVHGATSFDKISHRHAAESLQRRKPNG